MTQTPILPRNPLLVHSYPDYDSLDMVFGWSIIFLLAIFFSFSSFPTYYVRVTDESLLICVYKRKGFMLSLHHFSSFVNVRLQFMDSLFSDCLSFIVQSLFFLFLFLNIFGGHMRCALYLLLFSV